MELVDLWIKFDANVNDEELLPLAETAFNIALDAQKMFLDFPDTEIHVWVEQGTTNFKTKVIAGIVILYNGIANLDGFVNGVKMINEYSQKTINYITEQTIENNNSQVLNISGSKGTPEKLAKILTEVKSGSITVAEGTNKVLKLIEAEEGTAEEKEFIINSFKAAAEDTTGNAQIKLFNDIEYTTNPKESSKRTRSSKPAAKASLHGIEMWYDRRTGQRHVRRYNK